MICLAFDPGPKTCGFALAKLKPEMRGRPMFIGGGKVDSDHETISICLRDHREVDIVAVETPAGYVHEHARGAQLLETRGEASMIAAIARVIGLLVVEMTAGEWRRQLTGKSNASDAVIARACAMLASGLPKRSSVHTRDALGLAIVSLTRPKIPLQAIREYR